MNTSVLIGNLTKDVELRQVGNGTSVARFTLAVQRQFKNANGEKETDFIQCQAWKKTAELLAQYCQKGSKIAVRGSIRTGSYEKDGARVYTTEVVAEEIEFLTPKSSTNNGANNQNATGNQYGGNQGGFQQQQQQSYNQQPSYQNSGVNEDPFAQGQQQSNNIEQDLPF